MAINPAKPQDTFDHVFGSGALSYSWWQRTQMAAGMTAVDVPDDWQVKVTAEDPDDEDGSINRTVTHKVIMATARKVIAGEYGLRGVILTRECRNLVFDADEADLDAPLADSLLQLVMYGDVIFG